MLVDRSLSQAVLAGVFMALAVLAGILFFLTFLGQLDNIGTGDFSVSTAFVYAALALPQTVYEIMPVATLIGALFAIGALAARQELMIFRVSGASVWRLARAVFWGGLVLAFLTVLLGEFVAPPAKRIAETLRVQKMYAQIGAIGAGSLWLKSGNSIVHVLSVDSARHLAGVYIYTLNAEHEIVAIRQAKSATFGAGHWTLHHVRGTLFRDGRTEVVKARQRPWPSFVTPSTFEILTVSPEKLSWRKLSRYIAYLRANGLNSLRYRTAFWHKIAVPVSVLLMAFLALPFAIGRLRSGGAGQRLAVGVGIGLAYYLVDRAVLEASQGLRLMPMVAAWVPTLLLAIVTFFAMRRAR